VYVRFVVDEISEYSGVELGIFQRCIAFNLRIA